MPPSPRIPSLHPPRPPSLFPCRSRVYLAVFHSANLNWLFRRRHTGTWCPDVGTPKTSCARRRPSRRDVPAMRADYGGFSAGMKLNDTGDGRMMYRSRARACREIPRASHVCASRVSEEPSPPRNGFIGGFIC